MKHINRLFFMALFMSFAFMTTVQAQLDLPRGSQKATVSQTIGISKVYIKYSRPSVNGRDVWGALVPYGMNNLGFGTAEASPWRAGANENTIIKFTADATVEGKSLSAGVYGLHMIIHEDDTATVIFSKNHSAWGSYFYEPSEDALRVKVKTKSIPHVEQLTYGFENVTANGATVTLSWEKKQIPFSFEMNVTETVMADIRRKLQDQPGFNRQTWEQAAGFAANNGGDLNEALEWINNAIAGQFYSQQTFNNTQIKAQILQKMGKPQDALAIMDSYMPNATVLEAHQYGRFLIGQGMQDKSLRSF